MMSAHFTQQQHRTIRIIKVIRTDTVIQDLVESKVNKLASKLPKPFPTVFLSFAMAKDSDQMKFTFGLSHISIKKLSNEIADIKTNSTHAIDFKHSHKRNNSMKIIADKATKKCEENLLLPTLIMPI